MEKTVGKIENLGKIEGKKKGRVYHFRPLIKKLTKSNL